MKLPSPNHSHFFQTLLEEDDWGELLDAEEFLGPHACSSGRQVRALMLTNILVLLIDLDSVPVAVERTVVLGAISGLYSINGKVLERHHCLEQQFIHEALQGGTSLQLNQISGGILQMEFHS